MKTKSQSWRQVIEAKKPVGTVSYAEMRISMCLQSMENEYNKAIVDDRMNERHGAAKTGFKLRLPTLDTIEDVKAYISCVAVGVAHQVVTAHEGGQLLYAAQLALSSLRQESKPVGRPALASSGNEPARERVAQNDSEQKRKQRKEKTTGSSQAVEWQSTHEPDRSTGPTGGSVTRSR
jgi:hypothetical protein